MSFPRLVRFVLTVLCLVSGGAAFAQNPPPIPANDIRIHYHRPDAQYTGWTVYAFGDTTEDTGNFSGGPVQSAGTDSFGVYFDVGITTGATNVGIIVHTGNTKDPGPDESVNPSTQGHEFWQLSEVQGLSTTSRPRGHRRTRTSPRTSRECISSARTASTRTGRSTPSTTRPPTPATTAADRSK